MNYLYLKTHNQTGYKYLGKTKSKDPHTYQGSGKLWKRHINKYGYDVTTKILFETENDEDLKQMGLYYSNIYNVVESTDFANLIPESGDGGAMPWTQESREKVSKSLTGIVRSNTQNYSIAQQRRKKETSIKMKKFLSDPVEYEKRCLQLRENADYKKIGKSISKLKWCNDGVRNYRKEVIPEGYLVGRIKHTL